VTKQARTWNIAANIPAAIPPPASEGDAADPQDAENCSSGHSARRPSCPQPTPGAAAGGCAYDGSAITLVPVADVAHLVHGPIGCLGNSWETRGSLSSGSTLHRRAFTTNLSEHDVIFGSEGTLRDAILDIGRRFRPPAVFVYLTCVPGLIGDDVEAVCRHAAAELGLPVVPVLAAGFTGTKNAGNRLGGSALLTHVIGTAEPTYTTPCDINLIGEYNIAGELWQVLPLLDRLGIRVLSKISGDARYAELTWAHRAKANMVVCSRALLSLAEDLRTQYGTPWFEGSFYGVRATSEALRGFAKVLGDPELPARTEVLIAEEETRVAARLASYRKRLSGVRAVLYTGGVKSWSMVAALQDSGIEVVATGTKKSTPDDVTRIRGLLGADAHLIEEGNPRDLLRIVRESGATLLAAGGRNMYTAAKGRVPFLDVNQERHQAYAGYDGVVALAAEIDRVVSSPVFAAVRRPAPWAAHQLSGMPVGTLAAARVPVRLAG
jgi:nitrogenase molybdenum-cofactor synthesis protein NifE